MTLEAFGQVGPNDWPLVVPCKWKIYGEAADHFRDKFRKAPVFRTANAAMKMLKKLYRERTTMTAIPWPNKLGWDVGEDAEVWKLNTGLDVCVFTEDCKIKHLIIADLTLDPVEAVQRCRREGTIEEE